MNAWQSTLDQTVRHLTCIWEMLSSYLGHNTDYHDSFYCILRYLQWNTIAVPTLRNNHFVPNSFLLKEGVNCTLVQALSLYTGRTVHRGSRSITVLFLDHGNRRGWVVSVTPRPLFTPEKDTVPIVQEAGWAPGPVWTGAENLASQTGFDPRTV